MRCHYSMCVHCRQAEELMRKLHASRPKATTQDAQFGYPIDVFNDLLQSPIDITELGACELPERAMSASGSRVRGAPRERLVRLCTVGGIRNVMGKYICSIDTGMCCVVRRCCAMSITVNRLQNVGCCCNWQVRRDRARLARKVLRRCRR